MIATNHALTGSIIGLVSGNPLIAIPAAVASHFVCDMLPHFGLGPKFVETKAFRRYLVGDAALCGVLVLVLAITQPAHWLLAAFAAFAAASPDFLSINKFLTIKAGKSYQPGLYVRFASRIQWFERPIGWVVELAWAAAAIYLLTALI